MNRYVTVIIGLQSIVIYAHYVPFVHAFVTHRNVNTLIMKMQRPFGKHFILLISLFFLIPLRIRTEAIAQI